MFLSKSRRAILISCLGNSFEWYDFMVYAALAPVLAKVFFAGQQGFIAVLATYGTFAAGFLTRPFGALLFGYLGDHFGRRYALLLAIGMMMTPTFAIGCLPSYAVAGVWAPALLIGLRLLQGLAMSGEMPGCITFLTEMAPRRWQTTLTSLAVAAAMCGLLLGTNCVWWLNHCFGESKVQAWLWRVPFWLSGVLGILIFFLRRTLPESDAFLKLQQTEKHPVALCFRQYWRPIVLGIGCYAANGIGFYFLMAFSQTYFQHYVQVPLIIALTYTICLQITMLLGLPLGGLLADYFGRRRVGLACLLTMLGGLYPSMIFLSHAPSTPSVMTFIGLIVIAAVFSVYSALLPSATSTLFPTQVRFTGVALLNNTALTIFGGFSPMLISYLIEHCQSLVSPTWPMTACFALSLLSFWYLPKTNTSENQA